MAYKPTLDWRTRDECFWSFIDRHPATTKQLVTARLFPSYRVANRRLVRMKKRTRGRTPMVVGTVAMKDVGREALVYCGYRPRAVKHEVFLTDYLLSFGHPMDQWERGMKTCSKYKPDAETEKLLIEFDMSTESRKQMQKQIIQQRTSEKTVLWVVHSLARFNWVEEVANKSNTLMTMVGHDHVYDMTGNRMAVSELVASL